jgi:hypothetical protein
MCLPVCTLRSLETVPSITRTSHDPEEALHRLFIARPSVYKCV